MNARELALLVQATLDAQKRYFASRERGDLEAAKRLERELAQAAAAVLAGPSLFDREGVADA